MKEKGPARELTELKLAIKKQPFEAEQEAIGSEKRELIEQGVIENKHQVSLEKQAKDRLFEDAFGPDGNFV